MKASSFRQLVKSEWRLRDQSSLYGFTFSLLNPFISWAIILLVLGQSFAKYQEDYEIYLLIGIFFWGFFSRASSVGMQAPFIRQSYITQLPIGATKVVLAQLMAIIGSFVLESLLILIVALVLFEASLGSALLFFVSVLLLICLTTGVAMILALCNVFIRDIGRIWGIIVRIGFFATPIFYPISFLESRAAWILYVNPMSHVMRLGREGVGVGSSLGSLHESLLFASVFSIVMLALGYYLLRRAERKIPEFL